MTRGIATIVLAAGESRRMGRPKALLPWSGGTVLDAILRAVEAAGLSQPVIVTGAHHGELSESLAGRPVRICENPGWASGMGGSIRCGLEAALEANPGLEGILVLLADQPLVTENYLLRMLADFSKNKQGIVATRYPEGGGVPAIFPPGYFEALRETGRQGGASKLIREAGTIARLLEPGTACRDMDTPREYRELRRLAGFPEIHGTDGGPDMAGSPGETLGS